MDCYKTVKKEESVEYTVKKSKFIGHIKNVKSQQEAQSYIAEISKKYWDATHNVYAYIIRDDRLKKFSDDGEPSGTAGKPILEVLEKNELTDVVIIVTRYFGGTLLGAGGLVRAYSHSASLAVNSGEIITNALCSRMAVNCDYNFYGKISSLISDNGGTIENTLYEDNVKIIFTLPCHLLDSFNSKLTEASNGKFSAVETERIYAQI